MSCNGWKHLKNYRLNDDFCARNIEMRSASRKKTGSSHYGSSMGIGIYALSHTTNNSTVLCNSFFCK